MYVCYYTSNNFKYNLQQNFYNNRNTTAKTQLWCIHVNNNIESIWNRWVWYTMKYVCYYILIDAESLSVINSVFIFK